MATLTPSNSPPATTNPAPGQLAGSIVEVTGTVDVLHPQLTKLGITTSELWFHVVAVALSALFASGVIPTTGPYATVALIAAAELSAFGYQVSRTSIKTSLASVIAALSRTAMLVLCLTAASSALSACAAGSTVRKDTSIGVVAAGSCELGNLGAKDAHDLGVWAQRTVDGWISGVKPGDLDAAKALILADLKKLEGQLLPCAIAGVVAVVTAPANPSSGTASQALAAATPDAAHTVAIAFQLAAREAGWPQLTTPGGRL